jgi:hypothetical protein
MQRTPVILAFFFAAALVGLFLRFTDMSGGKETFTLPSDEMAPINAPTTIGINPYNGTAPINGSEPGPVPELPYDVADDNKLMQFATNKVGPECCPSPYSTGAGCICLTQQDLSGAASRYGNKTSM